MWSGFWSSRRFTLMFSRSQIMMMFPIFVWHQYNRYVEYAVKNLIWIWHPCPLVEVAEILLFSTCIWLLCSRNERKSRLISGPSNFSHIAHMGPDQSMQVFIDLPNVSNIFLYTEHLYLADTLSNICTHLFLILF